MPRLLLLIATHLTALAVGFAVGIFLLPILSAPEAPTNTEVAALAREAEYSGEFRRDLAGSDFLHWGEGELSVSASMISLQGQIAPGPAYRLYLSPEFVESEAEFEARRAGMVQVGSVNVFENFVLPVPQGIDPGQYTTAVIWCESFSEFITAAKYR